MAKICLICEGSYPYVVGGVSSWIQELIRCNSEHEFSIVCIVPDEKFIDMKYQLPDNVKELKNIKLENNFQASPLRVIKNNFFVDRDIETKLETIMNFKNKDSKKALEILDFFSRERFGNPLEITASLKFWKALIKYYKEYHSNIGFNSYYWTYRNLFFNLFNLSQEKLPEADVYHAVATGYSGFLAALAGYRKKGKVLLTEHGIYPREREEEILGALWIDKKFKGIWIEFFYFLSRITYDYSQVIVSLFQYNKELQIENGAAPEKCKVISNGIDSEIYSSLEFEKKEKFSIGSVLRVVPIKDVKMMLKGYKIALKKIPNSHLYLIGPIDENKEYYEECLELVKNLELEKNVTFTGRTDVKEYYKFLDLQLLSSLSEGQPLSILEGLAAGIPCIATDVGNCREILTEKKDIGLAGLVVPPTSYRDLAEAIVKLYQNKEKREELGRNGKKIVQKYYTKKEFVENYKELYEKLSIRS